ncbi:hypothetical protein GCM10029992_21500 [Glycomyces albus]
MAPELKRTPHAPRSPAPRGDPENRPAQPEPTVLTVGFNRRRYTWLLAVGLPLFALSIAASVYWIPRESGPPEVHLFNLVQSVSVGGSTGLVCGALLGLLTKRYFTYDTRKRTILARGRWGSWRIYPRPRYERLDYSIEYAEVHEVRSDGRRHRLHIKSGWADPDDWHRFVASLQNRVRIPIEPHTDRPPESTRPTPRDNGGNQ